MSSGSGGAPRADLAMQVRDAIASDDAKRAAELLVEVRRLVHRGSGPNVGAPRGELTLAQLQELARDLEMALDIARP